jgi:hypothetical protein
MILPMFEVDCNRNEGLTIKVRPSTMGMGLLPASTMGHLRAANKELLLALRSVIDSAIEYTERQEPGARRPRRIQVRMGETPAEEAEEQ